MNCDESFLSLFKEIRTLNWLGIRPPVAVRVAGELTRACYSRVVTLRSALSTYVRIVQQTDRQVLELAREKEFDSDAMEALREVYVRARYDADADAQSVRQARAALEKLK